MFLRSPTLFFQIERTSGRLVVLNQSEACMQVFGLGTMVVHLRGILPAVWLGLAHQQNDDYHRARKDRQRKQCSDPSSFCCA